MLDRDDDYRALYHMCMVLPDWRGFVGLARFFLIVRTGSIESMHDRWPRGVSRTCIPVLCSLPQSCLIIPSQSRLATGSIPAHFYTLDHLNQLASAI